MSRTQIRPPLLAIVAALTVLPVAALADSVIPVFKIKGPLAEAPSQMALGELLGEATPVNMFELLERLRTVRTDSNVEAVVFEIDEAALGMAQIQELRDQFEAIKATEKDVWVFVETLTPAKLMLGGAASQFWLLPTGDVNINGLYGEASYYKNMMDHIRVEADILHCGDYKSAGEPFYRTGPSKEAEEQTNWLLDGMFEEMVGTIAKNRGLSPEKVRELIDRGSLTPRQAFEEKLVDKLGYREDFIASIRKNYGDAKISTKYGRDKAPKIDFSNPFAFFQVFSDMMKGKKPSTKPAVAVVHVESMITQGDTESGIFGGASNAGSNTVRKAIAKAAADDTVKALVLRVDSPGGSAIASDIICEATKRFKESGRPLIISMGNVAGSGGYYVSTLGDVIFAEPATITGSIGVVGGKIVTKGLWDWIGITGHEYKRGKYSDLMNTNRKFSDEERKLVSDWMNRIYEDFKSRVLEGRKDKIKGDLEPLAGGRVYTGKQALEIGLVDRLGGMADAIKFAASKAELGTNYEVRLYPEQKTLFDILLEGMSDDHDSENFVSIKASIGSRFAKLPTVAAALDAVQTVDPIKARALRNFLIQMELFSRECVLMVGPACTTTGVPGLN
ncbi:MAG: signal peptide peptidase SppA [Planctomycetota bacterium]|nr:MAG: signal peptide peptidase SppA [Planctomycetota bacterium]